MFAILSLWSRPLLQVRRDQASEEEKEAKSISPRTMSMAPGWFCPWGRCGLGEWLVEPISLLTSAQQPQEVLPREEKTLMGYRDTGSAPRTFTSLFPHGPRVTAEERASVRGQYRESDCKAGKRNSRLEDKGDAFSRKLIQYDSNSRWARYCPENLKALAKHENQHPCSFFSRVKQAHFC